MTTRRRPSRALGALVVAVGLALLGWLASSALASPSGSGPAATTAGSRAVPTDSTAAGHAAPAGPTSVPTGSTGSALAVLATLPVKGRAPMTGYARTADFGEAWLDVDRNGCDTRDDVLRRDLEQPRLQGCKVESGELHDPYTGRTIDFVRGVRTSTAVQIDHVVPLADAWRTGAQGWSREKRIALANDPLNLFAVDGPTNEQKGDGDAATWLPPVKTFRCTYIAHQVGVKHAYGLWVTAAEKAAMQRILTACPALPAPGSTLAP